MQIQLLITTVLGLTIIACTAPLPAPEAESDAPGPRLPRAGTPNSISSESDSYRPIQFVAVA